MRFLKYLQEEYFGLFVWKRVDYGGAKPIAGGPPDFPVFLNPDRKEMAEAHSSEWSRFCFDVENKKLYVWNVNILHAGMHEWLGKQGVKTDYPCDSLDQFVWGTSEIQGGKPTAILIERAKNQKGYKYVVSEHTLDLLSKWYTKDSIIACLKKPEPKRKRK